MPKINAHTGFELYLEGIKTPFSSLRISEQEGSVPTCSISLTATNGTMRILPSTIVQVFGPWNDEQVLMFEGEVQQISYQKGFQGRLLSIEAKHILNTALNSSIRPQHTIRDQARTAAEGAFVGGSKVLAISSKIIEGVRTNNQGTSSENTTQQVIEENFDDIDVSGVLNFVGVFIDLLNNSGDEESNLIREGEYHYIVQYFLNYFEQSNLYYGLLSKSFRIPDSVFSWPNFSQTTLFKNRMIINRWQSIVSQLQKATPGKRDLFLSEAIQSLLETIIYTFVVPSTPTYSHLFWRNSTDRGPLRMQFLPSLDNSPPILANVFFPSDVASFSYRRNMEREPTRVIGEVDLPLVTREIQEYGVLPHYLEPNLNLTEEQVKENKIGFTTEETYRGIKSYTVPLDHMFSATFIETLNFERIKNLGFIDPGDASRFLIPKAEVEESFKGAGNSLQQLTLDHYLRGKYEGRIATAVVDWNPNRVVGLPGLLLEEGAPSIVGVVSALSTTIDANGNANSTISLRSPRLVYADNAAFNNNDSDEEIVNDFTNDSFLNTNEFLFDPELYSFLNVGKDLYNYVMFGLGSESGNKLSGESAEGFRSFSENILNMEKTSNIDSSILSFLYEGDELQSELIEESDSVEVKLSKLVHESVQKLQQYYKDVVSESENDELKDRLRQITNRRLVTKQEYFDFIGVVLNVDETEALDIHYKDSVKTMKGEHNLKTIEQTVNELNRGNGVIDSIGNVNSKIQKTTRDLDYYRNIKLSIERSDISFSMSDYLAVRRKDFTHVDENIIQSIRNEYNQDFGRSIISDRVEKLEEELAELERKKEAISKPAKDRLDAVEILKPYNLIRRNHISLGFLQDMETINNIKVVK